MGASRSSVEEGRSLTPRTEPTWNMSNRRAVLRVRMPVVPALSAGFWRAPA